MLVKDTEALERIQKRATKFILGNSDGDYKERLVKLKLLPLMYSFELADIMLTHLKTKQIASALQISSQYPVLTQGHLTSSPSVTPDQATINTVISILTVCPDCGTAYRPLICLYLSSQCIKTLIKRFLWSHFVTHFDPYNIIMFLSFSLSLQ